MWTIVVALMIDHSMETLLTCDRTPLAGFNTALMVVHNAVPIAKSVVLVKSAFAGSVTSVLADMTGQACSGKIDC
jgi:hypothetical protein